MSPRRLSSGLAALAYPSVRPAANMSQKSFMDVHTAHGKLARADQRQSGKRPPTSPARGVKPTSVSSEHTARVAPGVARSARACRVSSTGSYRRRVRTPCFLLFDPLPVPVAVPASLLLVT